MCKTLKALKTPAFRAGVLCWEKRKIFLELLFIFLLTSFEQTFIIQIYQLRTDVSK